jgi:hypothetical protein
MTAILGTLELRRLASRRPTTPSQELFARLWPAVEVAVEVHAHRLPVLRTVSARAFVAVLHLDHARAQCRPEFSTARRPTVEACQRRAKDERHNPRSPGEDVLLREHPAQGRAERVNPLRTPVGRQRRPPSPTGFAFTTGLALKRDRTSPENLNRPLLAALAAVLYTFPRRD